MEKITALIYGKENCPFCDRAKMLVKEIQKREKVELTLDYHDFIQENISKEEVTNKVGSPNLILTVPQIKLIFSDKEEYIGGFNEFYSYVTSKTTWLK